MSKKSKTQKYTLTWHGDEIKSAMTEAIAEGLADMMLEAETQAKERLYPGHGYDSGSMQRAVHVAKPNYNWKADHQPASPTTPERGGVRVLPTSTGGSGLRMELGCGQDYTIYYHQKHDPFLLIAFESAQRRTMDFIRPYLAAKGFTR